MNLHNLSRRGFESVEELHDMVAQLNLVKQGEAFKTWDDRAGSKDDLQALLPPPPPLSSFAELYAKHKGDENASGLAVAMYDWRQAAIAERTRITFDGFNETIDEKMAAGASELDAFASVTLSALARIVAVERTEVEIKSVFKAAAIEEKAKTAKPEKKRVRRKK